MQLGQLERFIQSNPRRVFLKQLSNIFVIQYLFIQISYVDVPFYFFRRK